MYTVTRGIFPKFHSSRTLCWCLSLVSLVSVWISSPRNSHFLHMYHCWDYKGGACCLWRDTAESLSCLLSPFLLSSLPPALPPFHNSFLLPLFFFLSFLEWISHAYCFQGMCQHWKSKEEYEDSKRKKTQSYHLKELIIRQREIDSK